MSQGEPSPASNEAPAPSTPVSLVAVLVATLAAYASALGNRFVSDDEHVIVHGRLIGSLANIPALFAHDSFYNSFGDAGDPHLQVRTYRPLTLATFFVERALWGLKPAFYHLDSVLLHAGNGALLFLLGRRLGLSPLTATFGAVLFAVHPSMSEAVHWVNGRSDPLVVSFWLMACLASVATPFKHSRAPLIALAVFAATLCKELAYPLVVAAALLVYHRHGFLAGLRVYAWWIVGAGAGLVARLLALKATATGSSSAVLRFALSRLPVLFWDATVSFLVPSPVLRASLYDRYAHPPPALFVAGGALLAVGAIAAILHLRQRKLWWPWLFATAALTLGPVALIANFEGWSGWGRYLYPSSTVAALSAAYLLGERVAPALSAARRRVLYALASAFLVLCAVQTFRAGAKWYDPRAFAQSLYEDQPESSIGYYSLAEIELTENHPARAVTLARRATEINPRFGRSWSVLAQAHYVLGERERAFEAARRALDVSPYDLNALFLLGIEAQERDPAFATRRFVRVLARAPGQAGVWATLRAHLRRTGRHGPAALALERSIRDPRYASLAPRLAQLLESTPEAPAPP